MRIITLGVDCGVTFRLRDLKIKQENSLFEWWASPIFKEVVDVLEKCLNGEKLVVVNTHMVGNHNYEGTTIRTAHYIGKTGERSIDAIVDRRSERLREYLCGSEKVIFMRELGGDNILETVKRFKEVIERFNPSLQYKLIIMDNSLEPCEPLEHVFFYKIDRSKYMEYIYNCFGEHPPIVPRIITDMDP